MPCIFFTAKKAAQGHKKGSNNEKKPATCWSYKKLKQVAKKSDQFREERCPDTLLLKEFKS